jgi:hypothetical protein
MTQRLMIVFILPNYLVYFLHNEIKLIERVGEYIFRNYFENNKENILVPAERDVGRMFKYP